MLFFKRAVNVCIESVIYLRFAPDRREEHTMDQKLDLTGFRITSVSGKIPLKESNLLQPTNIPDTPTSPLGLLAGFIGDWRGVGFNQIWRPARGGSDHFLELNQTLEDLQFVEIAGEIPNRGFLQDDFNLHGMTYIQTISDAVVKDQNGNPPGLHIEPGIWVNIPPTSEPNEPRTVARMANIPHGTSLVAQGVATQVQGGPEIDPVDITPFLIGTPEDKIKFPEVDLSTPSTFRTPSAQIPNVSQEMIGDPNSFLRSIVSKQKITSHVLIKISTKPSTGPDVGGGISNIAFLQGSAAQGPNAQAAQMDATFWIETVVDENGKESLQIQYSQMVLLNFNGLSWPHVSVASLQPVIRS
jgi:hypothetical protein